MYCGGFCPICQELEIFPTTVVSHLLCDITKLYTVKPPVCMNDIYQGTAAPNPKDSPYYRDFVALWGSVESVRQRMIDEEITPPEAAEILRTMKVPDADGYQWGMIADEDTGQLMLYRERAGHAEYFSDGEQFAYYPTEGGPPQPPPQTYDTPHDPYSNQAQSGFPPVDLGTADYVPPPDTGLSIKADKSFLSQTWVKAVIGAIVVFVLIWVIFLRGSEEVPQTVPGVEPEPPAATDQTGQTVPTGQGPEDTGQEDIVQVITDTPNGPAPPAFATAWQSFLNAARQGDFETAIQWMSADAMSGRTYAEIYEVASQWAGTKQMGMDTYPTPPDMSSVPTQIRVSVYFDPEPENSDKTSQAISSRSLCGVLTFVDIASNGTWRLESWPLLDSGAPCEQ